MDDTTPPPSDPDAKTTSEAPPPELVLERAARFGPIDERIARLVVAGDLGSAADAVIQEYGAEINGIVHAYLSYNPDAADVFQNFSLRLPRALRIFGWLCPVRNRAIQTAMSVARSYLRERRKPPNGGGSFDGDLGSGFAIDPASFEAGVGRDVYRLSCALRQLDELTRAIIIVRNKGYSWEEVAVMLSDEETRVTPAAAAQRYHRAVHDDELRKHYDALPKECGTAACPCGRALTSLSKNFSLNSVGSQGDVWCK